MHDDSNLLCVTGFMLPLVVFVKSSKEPFLGFFNSSYVAFTFNVYWSHCILCIICKIKIVWHISFCNHWGNLLPLHSILIALIWRHCFQMWFLWRKLFWQQMAVTAKDYCATSLTINERSTFFIAFIFVFYIFYWTNYEAGRDIRQVLGHKMSCLRSVLTSLPNYTVGPIHDITRKPLSFHTFPATTTL